jgi:hypothetical protein
MIYHLPFDDIENMPWTAVQHNSRDSAAVLKTSVG